MIRHAFTLMWNRRRANALLVLEIFLAYVVLFAVGTIGTSLWLNYRQPLGFRYDDVWEVSFASGTQPRAERYHTFEQVLARLRTTPGVLAVAATANNTPFSFNASRMSTDEGALRDINIYAVGPELREVMDLELTAGRWFDQRDATPGPHAPLVITAQLQRALYPGGESAVGRLAELNGKEKQRIIGVVSAYRTDGELKEVLPGMFSPLLPADSATHDVRTLLVRVAPGSGAALEKRLTDDIRRIGPGWSSTIRTLREMHRTQFKQVMTKPLLLGVMSIFLLLNVALGLFGVLWQAISQRRAELGVRRALGAPAGAIARLIVGETLALTTFGLLLGLLVAAQFPLLGAFEVRAGVYLTAMGLAAAGLYLLAFVCALYPSQLAARIQPAVALREE
jgi:putative ABC transport system permease protein